MSLELDGRKLNVVETAAGGVVGPETIFHFHQVGDVVWADYAGGAIERGHLIGRLQGSQLQFRYCQIQKDGRLDGGVSNCELGRTPDGVRQLEEHFDWASREGSGTNLMRECDA